MLSCAWSKAGQVFCEVRTHDDLRHFRTSNDTSTFQHLPELGIDELNPLQLSCQEYQAIDGVVKVLSVLSSTAICFQKEDLTVENVRVLFNTVVNYMRQMMVRLLPDASIVDSVAIS